VCVCVYGKGRERGTKDRYFRWGCVTRYRTVRLGREKKGPKNIYIYNILDGSVGWMDR